MPSDMVSLVVSTGLGVSVLAGILSGVCYVLVHGVTSFSSKPRNRKGATREWYCDICGRYLRSIAGVLENEVVTCSKCQNRVCKFRCASEKSQKAWMCQVCLKPPESWFQGILNAIQPSNIVISKMSSNNDCIPEWDEDLEAIRKKEKEQVRDFIEKLVTSMLGEDVDDTSINKLYNDKKYLPVIGQTPCTAHAALKQLIQRLIQDATDLPHLQPSEEQNRAHPTDEANRTYEDLLATAILNKVITSCQHLPSSSRASVSSRSSRHQDKEYFFGEETLDAKWKTTDLDTTSLSSLDDFALSDSSLGSKKYVDRTTLTIKHNIEEIYNTDSDNDDDGSFLRPTSSLLGDDDTNWYLQKRQFKGTHSPVPVPMLVPNPTVEAKVLIGDQEIEETSDLSDVESDFGETESVSGVNSLLVESKTIIGGKNALESLDVELEGVLSAKTDITVDDDNVEDASISSVLSSIEKDTEYTIGYASLPRTIEKPKEVEPELDLDVNDNVTFNGNYSKREKEKWKNAIQMENNPYSKENIEKRIQKSNSSVGSMFGADYYRRQASKPAGAKGLTPSGSPTAEVISPPVWPRRPSTPSSDEEVYIAQPALIEIEDEPVEPTIIPQDEDREEQTVEMNISEMTSDSDLSYINFYDVEKSQVYFNRRPSTETIVNEEDKDENDNIVKMKEAAIIPQARPRLFTKNTSTPNNNNNIIDKPESQPVRNLKRFKSEGDLFEDRPIIHRKKDNTLISKIYQNPNVRSFALTNRDSIPIENVETRPKVEYKQQSSVDVNLINMTQIHRSNPNLNNSLENLLSPQKHKGFFSSSEEDLLSLEAEVIEAPKKELLVREMRSESPGNELSQLSQRKLVASIKDQFSKSFPELSPIKKSKIERTKLYDSEENIIAESQTDSELNSSISVKDLKKRFENYDKVNREKPIYSLTARSISKTLREELKK